MTKRIVVYRLVALAVLVGLFDGLDWMPLRVVQRDVIGWSVRVAGYAPEAFVHEGSPALRVGDEVYYYTAECTYLDLFMIVAPFVWVFGVSRRAVTWRSIRCLLRLVLVVVRTSVLNLRLRIKLLGNEPHCVPVLLRWSRKEC